MTESTTLEPTTRQAPKQVAVVDLLDRLLGAGVVLSGDITISIAGVDLVEIRLHALLTSVRAEMRNGNDEPRRESTDDRD